MTDRLAITSPHMEKEAYLDPAFAGDPPAPCPREAIAGSQMEKPE